MGAALPALRALPGVEQVHFHPDANDPNTVWAYWRLTSRDHLFEVYESQAFKEMVQSSMALLADRPEDFFLDEEAGSP
jgi:quinol monooxygenase YgiN